MHPWKWGSSSFYDILTEQPQWVFQTCLSHFNSLEVWFNKSTICFHCRGRYTWKTAGWNYFPKPDAANKRKSSNSFSFLGLIADFYSCTLSIWSHWAHQGWLTVDFFFCLFYSPAAPCHTPSLLISLDKIPRSSQDDRSLLPLSLSIKHFAVPAGEIKEFAVASAAVSFIP